MRQWRGDMSALLARARLLVSQREHRTWLAAGSGALVVLLISLTVLGFNLQQRDPSVPSTPVAHVPATTPTYTATSAPTSTPHPTVTPRPTRAPVYIPPPPATKLSVPAPPPPPPLPTPPPATPTVTLCPTPTPLPTATPTPPTPTPSATATGTATGTATSTATPTVSSTSGTASPSPSATTFRSTTILLASVGAAPCQSCPYYAGNNPSQSQIAAAINTAAATYNLPVNLIRAVAWQESQWHEDVTSCDGGVGLMQIQYYYADYFNSLNYPVCGVSTTSYDIYTLQGNADLGAKYLAYLKCYWTFGGPYGGTQASPATDSSEWYYFQSGLSYPDGNYCPAVYNDPTMPQYKALPLSAPADWSCPYAAKSGDNTILEMTVSAYNEGAGAVIQYGIQNGYYVQAVEGYVVDFYNGALP